MKLFRKSVSIIVAATFFLIGCAPGGGGSGGKGLGVGPPVSSTLFESKLEAEPVVQKPKLDIIIPVFDPSLFEDSKKNKEAGIWPELRRGEAVHFAHKMKLALEETDSFGAVRVMPDTTATGDLYVVGKIIESNGEEVEIDIKVYDISGELWFNKSFDHEVEDDFYTNTRNAGKDPYDPVFDEAAEQIVEELEGHTADDLEKMKALTDIRFGANFSEEAFSKHMEIKNGKARLVSYPDKNDSMLMRTKAVRVRDQLFTDRMQPHYEQFSQQMQTSYAIWQKQSFVELRAARKARNEAIASALAGIALITLAVFSVAAGAKSQNYSGASAGAAGAIFAGSVGMGLLGDSSKMSEEAKFHRDAIVELGQSVDGEMAPQVIKFKEKTLNLTGSAKEQFSQWRAFLKSIYEQEATPEIML